MRYVSCPVSQKGATLHQFTFTMSNYNYRPLSRRDTQLNNHYILYLNSLKDYKPKTGSKVDIFFIKRFFVVIKLTIYA